MLRKLFLTFIMIILPAAIWAFPGDCQFEDTVIVSGDVGGQTWTPDTLYVMVGHCVVYDGGVLTIEPGTIIWGTNPFSTWDPAEDYPGALIIAQGGQIDAQGTREQPIVFTVEGDDPCDPYDIAYGSRQLWGGIIICGRADINTTLPTGNIEGIPVENGYGVYGAEPPINDDNSGTLRYVSVRHGGFEIGEGNEINGITFGAVGSGTTIDYVEVFNNYDDGVEFFGGQPNLKHMAMFGNGDDCFDYDEGFNGKGQFWFAMYDSLLGDKNGEHDGGTTPEDGTPFATPTIYNATYVGVGYGTGHDVTKNSRIFNIRDNAGGHYKNSIFTQGAQKVLEIEDLASGEDSRHRLETGDLTFENNMWYGFGDYDGTVTSILDQPYTVDYFDNNPTWQGVSTNTTGPTNDMNTVDPQLHSLSWSDYSQGIDPRPNVGSPAIGGSMAAYTDPFFTSVDYKGAFGEYQDGNLDALWLRGWTHIWERAMTPFICGDYNYDNSVNVLDVIGFINWKFKRGRMPEPLLAANVNGDGSVNVLDIIYLINFKFKGGPAPVCPTAP